MKATPLLVGLLPLVGAGETKENTSLQISYTACAQACDDLARLLPDITLRGSQARTVMWSLFQANVRPQCRVEPNSPQQVATALSAVVNRSCHFAVLGGGTAPFRGASNADGGVTIDLKALRFVRESNDYPNSIDVGGGALWADVYGYLDPKNLTAAGTRNSLTGVAGSILGGGISFFSQQHGWSCDNVAEFEVVLANSSIVRASQGTNPDLFWALRGGGNNFGIITKVTLDVFVREPSWYTFQLWDMRSLEAVFHRLERMTARMPSGVDMGATTLGWANHLKEFVITERLVGSMLPKLPKSLPIRNSIHRPFKAALDEHIYRLPSLEMARKMDKMNAEGFFNYFGSISFQNDASLSQLIANIFFDEVENIKNATGVQVYIVYNPVTLSALGHMKKRGGNALGLEEDDGPLTIVNINLHWAQEPDTPRMRLFIRNFLRRAEQTARSSGLHHPYIFLNHCYEEQDPIASYGLENQKRLLQIRDEVDPSGVFSILQPGFHKLDYQIKSKF